jgi:hypothetical protein
MAPTPDIQRLLDQIYGPEKGRAAFGRVSALIERFPARARRKTQRFSEKDVLLITYGDSLRKEGQRPLQTLHGFAERYLKDRFSGIHFLPFFPYSSDDGFSVMDFHTIDPGLGDWQDVRAVGQDFEMMFDFVINHFSAQGQWFADYLADVPGCRDLALEADPTADLSQVTRPRALPLLTPFTKHDGTTVHLWTTFSADQIDFNYRSLDVLEKMLAVMLRYVENGATLLRLDAIAYLWKEIGTPCIHLPQTHAMVKLFRAVLDAVAPDVIIVTETNVPHAENISYFGSGRDEAQMVYNFTLPPLLLHTFVTGDAAVLSEWARTLNLPSDETTFFNFTASHDGIGVRPLEGILPPAEVDALARHAEAMGGQVSRKNNPDGTQSPYELNVTYVDAILGDPGLEDAGKFMASQAIQYVLPGVPGTYIHSLIGSRNWIEGVNQTGRARTINRGKAAGGGGGGGTGHARVLQGPGLFSLPGNDRPAPPPAGLPPQGRLRGAHSGSARVRHLAPGVRPAGGGRHQRDRRSGASGTRRLRAVGCGDGPGVGQRIGRKRDHRLGALSKRLDDRRPEIDRHGRGAGRSRDPLLLALGPIDWVGN